MRMRILSPLLALVEAAPFPPQDTRRRRFPGQTPGLLQTFRRGPMAGVEEIVFAVRGVLGEHWYANFGYTAGSPQQMRYGPPGGRLCRLHLASGKVATLLDDPAGRRPRSAGPLRRQEDPLLLSQGRHDPLPSLRDQRRRHGPAAAHRRRLRRHRADPTCPTATSSSSPPLQALGELLVHAGGGHAPLRRRRQQHPAHLEPTSSRTTRPGRCPTAAFSTPAGSTSTAARSTITTSGRSTPTAPARWSISATCTPAP